jgi:hypothetical protein
MQSAAKTAGGVCKLAGILAVETALAFIAFVLEAHQHLQLDCDLS